MKAAACLRVTPTGMYWRDAPPVAVRPVGGCRVQLTASAGGPLGGDDLGIEVDVRRDCALHVSSGAATVVGPGPGPAEYGIDLRVAAGAAVRWAPLASVVCTGAEYHSRLRARLDPAASLVVREQVVLGRSGEVGGRYRGELNVTVGERPLVHHECVLDGADIDLSGPGGSGGYRVLGTLLITGPTVRALGEQGGREDDLVWAVLPLAGPGHLVIALGMTATRVDALIDQWDAR